MAVYYCQECDRLMDDDYFPMQEGEICPDCDIEKEYQASVEFVEKQLEESWL